MMHVAPSEFVYRIPGTSHGARPGAHRSNSRGAGMNFVSHAKLIDQPDPRRLDLRASISSIQRDWLVRINKQRASINISVLVDVSQSMHFGITRKKIDVAIEFLQALGFSAGGLGDAVTLVPFDSVKRDDLTMPSRYGRGVGQTMADLINNATPTANSRASIDAFSQCVESVGGKSALTFIVSDFHWSIENLDRMLEPLSGSMIVPLVIWDKAEITPPSSSRLMSVRQLGAETTRHIWLSPAVREKWVKNVEDRQSTISSVFASRDAKPFWMTNGFDAEKLSRYFMESLV